MTTKETRRIIEEAAFYASSYNYSRTHENEERAQRMLNSFDTVTMLASRLNVDITVVKSENGYFAALGTDLGGEKYYILWCTSCSSFVDDETYREYNKFAHHKKDIEKYTVYSTDGNGEMMIKE